MLAVIDWELCTLGNPLNDLAFMLMVFLPVEMFPYSLSKYKLYHCIVCSVLSNMMGCFYKLLNSVSWKVSMLVLVLNFNAMFIHHMCI